MSDFEPLSEGGNHPLAHIVEVADAYIAEHRVETVADYRAHRQDLKNLLKAESCESIFYDEAVGITLKNGAQLKVINDGEVLHGEVDSPKLEGYFLGVGMRAMPLDTNVFDSLLDESVDRTGVNPWSNSDHTIQLELVAKIKPLNPPDGLSEAVCVNIPLVDIEDLDFIEVNHPFLQEAEVFKGVAELAEYQSEDALTELAKTLGIWSRFIDVRIDLYFLEDSMFHAPITEADFKSSVIDLNNHGILEYKHLHKVRAQEFEWRWEQRPGPNGVDVQEPALFVLLELLDKQDIEKYGRNWMYVDIDDIQFGQNQEIKSRIHGDDDIFAKERAFFASFLGEGREEKFLEQMRESESETTDDTAVDTALKHVNKGGFSRIVNSTVALGFNEPVVAALSRTEDGDGFQTTLPATIELIGKIKRYELIRASYTDGSESILPYCVIDISNNPQFAHLQVDEAVVPISGVKRSSIIQAVYLN